MLNKKEIATFIKESVEWLVAEQQGCCRYKLDDHLAIFVGWSGGYDKEKDDTLIQANDDPTYAINAGIKVWTSDDLWTDYDWINFPYEKDGDVWDMGLSIAPNDNYKRIVDSLLKWYYEVCSFTIADNGEILKNMMCVCEHCLMAIESREGNQATLKHGVDEMDAIESRCDWCHECGFDTLYELI